MKAGIRRLLALFDSPWLWATLGTPVPGVNIAIVLAFGILNFGRGEGMRRNIIRCLNVQITYTLLFIMPLALAVILSTLEAAPSGVEVPPHLVLKVATGFPLGAVSLLAILFLAFCNVRTLAHEILHRRNADVPRIRFVPERRQRTT